jgi:hypothetical protein
VSHKQISSYSDSCLVFSLIRAQSQQPNGVCLAVVLDKNEIKNMLQYRKSKDHLVLVPKRFLTGLHNVMTDCALHRIPEDGFFSRYVKQLIGKDHPISLLYIPGDDRPVSKCSAFESHSVDKNLMFHATINNQRVRVWMDTGSTHCFAGHRLMNKLNCKLTASPFKSVQTANGTDNQILGSANLQVKFCEADVQTGWDMTVSFLPQFLRGVDLIIGCDWMVQHACHLMLDK